MQTEGAVQGGCSTGGAVLNDADQRFPLDLDRMIVAGHSNGASYAWYLACKRLDPRMNTFAPLAGTPLRKWAGPCQDARLRSHILHGHGRGDPVVPFGPIDEVWLGAEETVLSFADRLNCRRSEDTEQGAFALAHWGRCQNGRSYALAAFDGGHGVPTGWIDLVIDWAQTVQPR